MGSAPEGAAAASGATGADAAGSRPLIRRCIDCRHYRVRPKPALFSSTELQSPGGLKAYAEWQEQEKQYAQRESQMLSSGAAFTHEPHHFAWCAAYTKLELVERARAGDSDALETLMAEGGAELNPVTGEIAPMYAICIRMNPTGQCPLHELA